MTIFYYLCDCINAAVRAWLALQLADAIFEPKLTRKQIYIGQALIIAFIAIVQFANGYLSRSIFSNNMLVIMVFMITIASFGLYECKLRHSFCLNILSWTGMALIDFFIQICAWLLLDQFGGKTDILISIGIYRGIYLSICTLLLVLLGFILKRWFADKKVEISRFWKQSSAMAFLFLPCMVYFQRIYLRMEPKKLFQRWWMFFMGAALMFFVFGFYMLRKKLEEEKRIYELEIKVLETSYEGVLKGYKEKSVLMHDVKNHLRTLYVMLEEGTREECRSYIIQLTGEIQKKWNAVWTNHKVLDLVLNMKFQEAEEKQIKIRCQSDDLSKLKLDALEICALFANLLDNAIEANLNCSEEIERGIEMICKKQGGILVISISNPIESDMEDPDKIFSKTTKQDKTSHGFGMLSIESILHNHSGYLKGDIQKGWLKILIYLNAFEE